MTAPWFQSRDTDFRFLTSRMARGFVSVVSSSLVCGYFLRQHWKHTPNIKAVLKTLAKHVDFSVSFVGSEEKHSLH